VYGTQAIYFIPRNKNAAVIPPMFKELTVYKNVIIHLLLSPNFARIGQFMWMVEGEINLYPTARHLLRRLLRLITNPLTSLY